MRTPERLLPPTSRTVLLVIGLAAALAGLAPGFAPTAHAQVPATEVVPGDSLLSVRLSDGSTLVGRIESVQGARVVVVTEAGARVELDRASIVSVRSVATPFSDPNTSRLFFGPTGRTVPAGEGYIGLFELFLPFLSVGATDWLTLAGGTPIVPGAMGEVFYLAPKVRVLNLPRLQASGGVLAFFDGGETGSVGILYGVASAGDPDASGTLGVGFPFAATGDQNEIEDPIFLVGGESRVGRMTKLITENYIYFGEGGVLLTSAGVRFFGERFSGDIGIGAGIGAGEAACCLPIINVVYTFGGRR